MSLAEAYEKVYMGIKQRGVFETVQIEKGIKIMGMTTRTEYKVTNGVICKRKVTMRQRGPAGGGAAIQPAGYLLAGPQIC